MKALVVYDSAFGNTEQIAQAIGNGLGTEAGVQVLRASDVKPEQLEGLDLLIVGSPTQRFTSLPTISRFLKGIPGGSLSSPGRDLGEPEPAFRAPTNPPGPGLLPFPPPP